MNNTTGASYLARSAYHSGAHETNRVFNEVRVAQFLVLYVGVCKLSFVFGILFLGNEVVSFVFTRS